GSAQVESWVGFGVAFVLSLPDHIGKLSLAVVVIENEIERSAKHCFDAVDLISAAHQVVECADNGKSGSDVRFEEELRVVLAGEIFEFLIVLKLRRRRYLVA